MQIQEFREEVSSRLSRFISNEWAQMGLSLPRSRADPRPVDPEALILLSLEVGRDDPRLYGELADWLVRNQSLVSIQRLSNLLATEEDQLLVGATLGWASRHGFRSKRFSSADPDVAASDHPVPFFRNLHTPVHNLDPDFLRRGFEMSEFSPSGKSREPDYLTPINLGFRLRLIFGMGVRSELLRVLLARGSSAMTVKSLSNETAYSKRNVQEAINDLRSAGMLRLEPSGPTPSFSIDPGVWARFLDLHESKHEPVSWPDISLGLRRLLRWTWAVSDADFSEYLLSSQAAEIFSQTLSTFLLSPDQIGRPGVAGYWDRFTEVCLTAIDDLDHPSGVDFRSRFSWGRSF